jgi:hypothetical protein
LKKFISTSIIEFLKENKERNNYKGDIIDGSELDDLYGSCKR